MKDARCWKPSSVSKWQRRSPRLTQTAPFTDATASSSWSWSAQSEKSNASFAFRLHFHQAGSTMRITPYQAVCGGLPALYVSPHQRISSYKVPRGRKISSDPSCCGNCCIVLARLSWSLIDQCCVLRVFCDRTVEREVRCREDGGALCLLGIGAVWALDIVSLCHRIDSLLVWRSACNPATRQDDGTHPAVLVARMDGTSAASTTGVICGAAVTVLGLF
jgi:hypothetical protein